MVTASEIYHDSRILSEAESLSNKYDVTILAKKYPKQKIVKLPFKIKLIKSWNMPIFIFNILSSFYFLAKAALRENPDVYHAHDLDGLLCAYPAALRKRRKLIYDSHEVWSDMYPFSNLRAIQWLLPILEKFLIKKVNQGITVNNSIANYLEKKYHKNFLAIYNYPKIVKNKNTFNLKEMFPGKTIILHLGSADEGRGFEEIIETIKYLPKKYMLIFIGGGKTKGEIEKKIVVGSLEERIKFLPPVLPNEITESIRGASLGLALTQKQSLSYYYSLPNKIFHYVQAQIPILGSNFPEIKKVILKEQIGEVVNPATPKTIAKKIIYMDKNISKYKKNLERIRKDQYNWESESKKLLTLYKGLF